MKLQGLLFAGAAGLATMVAHMPTAHAAKGYYSAQHEVTDTTDPLFTPAFNEWLDPQLDVPWGLVATHNPCRQFTSLSCYGDAPPLYAVPSDQASNLTPGSGYTMLIPATQIEERKIFFTANNDSGVITVYDDLGHPVVNGSGPLVIDVPGAPTGLAYNSSCEAAITASSSGVHYESPCNTTSSSSTGNFDISLNGVHAPSYILTATRDGKIWGWNPGVSVADFQLAVDDSGEAADYMGLTVDPAAERVYAADFAGNKIVAYDKNWNRIQFINAAGNPRPYMRDIPALGYTPTNVAVVNGEVIVTYGKQGGVDYEDVGPLAPATNYQGVWGYVRAFTPHADGTYSIRHFNAPSDKLNAPWGIVMAPANFGPFSGKLYISNFGDGYINAFDPVTLDYIGRLGEDLTGAGTQNMTIWIPGIRGTWFKSKLYQGPSATIPMTFWWAERLFYSASLNFRAPPPLDEYSVFGFLRPN